MTDHPKVEGCSVTQLGSMANFAGLSRGSTAGHDLCHDLTSSGGATMTFPSEIMGGGNSLTSSSAADPWTQPDLVRGVRS